MLAFVIRRIGYMFFTLFVIALVSFGLNSIAYNNPALYLAPSKGATPEVIHQIEVRQHLNDPLYLQFWHFLTRGPDIVGTKIGLLHWPPSLGYSGVKQTGVTGLILDKLPATMSLAAGALVIWLLIAVPLGVLSATRPRSLLDRASTFVALFFLSFPTFVLGLLFLYLFYYQLTVHGHQWFPADGYVPLTQDPVEWAHHLVLPWFTLALTLIGVYVRVTRTSMLEVLGEDYIRTARAKGLSERRVVYRHALRSALTPIVTLAGLDFATLLGGAIITEQVFGIDGIGRLAVNSVGDGDLPTVVAVTLVASTFFVLANLVVDLLYAVLDSRVRLS